MDRHIKDMFFEGNKTITQYFILKSRALDLFEVLKGLTLVLLPKQETPQQTVTFCKTTVLHMVLFSTRVFSCVSYRYL